MTDEKGRFTFEPRLHCDHRLIADDGLGHRAEYTVKADELPSAVPTRDPGDSLGHAVEPGSIAPPDRHDESSSHVHGERRRPAGRKPSATRSRACGGTWTSGKPGCGCRISWAASAIFWGSRACCSISWEPGEKRRQPEQIRSPTRPCALSKLRSGDRQSPWRRLPACENDRLEAYPTWPSPQFLALMKPLFTSRICCVRLADRLSRGFPSQTADRSFIDSLDPRVRIVTAVVFAVAVSAASRRSTLGLALGIAALSVLRRPHPANRSAAAARAR